MNIDFHTITEAVADWFMQFFFDPMYHTSTEAKEESTVVSQVAVMKNAMSCLWKKSICLAKHVVVATQTQVTSSLIYFQEVAQGICLRSNALYLSIHNIQVLRSMVLLH